MSRFGRIVALLAICIAPVSCRDAIAPDSTPLGFTSNGTAVTLTNANGWPMYYMVVDPNTLALLDYVLCTNPASSCPRVPAHGSVQLTYDQILGHSSGSTKAQLIEYRLELTSPGHYEQRDFQTRTFDLQ